MPAVMPKRRARERSALNLCLRDKAPLATERLEEGLDIRLGQVAGSARQIEVKAPVRTDGEVPGVARAEVDPV
jgi:hypothetical protein